MLLVLLRSLFVLTALSLSATASAKDLSGKIGVGFNNTLPHMTGLSAKYGIPTGDPAIQVGVEAIGAFSATDGAGNDFFAGGRLSYALATEDNLNLYAAAGAGLKSTGEDQNVRIQPALGVEFFLFGLENLGFIAEAALNIDLGESTAIYTLSGSPVVGLYYYF